MPVLIGAAAQWFWGESPKIAATRSTSAMNNRATGSMTVTLVQYNRRYLGQLL
jgi:hypothetical protein